MIYISFHERVATAKLSLFSLTDYRRNSIKPQMHVTGKFIIITHSNYYVSTSFWHLGTSIDSSYVNTAVETVIGKVLNLMQFYTCTCMFVIIVYSIVDIDQVLTTVPIMKDVLALLMPIKDKWYLIGVSLEVNTVELDCLKFTNKSKENSLSIVINKWLEEKSNEATWKVLLEEVEGPIINNSEIADHIRTFLKKPSVYAKYVSQG